jgi:hypothetical protein
MNTPQSNKQFYDACVLASAEITKSYIGEMTMVSTPIVAKPTILSKKDDGVWYAPAGNPLTVPVGHHVTVTMTVKPKAYPMPLLNPKSVWGKRMAEKLAQKS